MEAIYSVQYVNTKERIKPQPDPKYYRFSDIPEDEAKRLISSNKKYRYLQRFENGEWVAQNNMKRRLQLHSEGILPNCYVSLKSEGFEPFLECLK